MQREETPMIDDQLIENLVSDDVETRKRAVMQLAKTKQREALQYLAEVFKEDEDPEVRDLARKGGLFIKKHLEESGAAGASASRPAPTRAASPPPASKNTRGSLLDDEDDAPSPAPASSRSSYPVPLSELNISADAEKRAKAMVKSALDNHMRGDNEKATQLIAKALRVDPKQARDPYTISLAATVVGIDGQEAIERLSPSSEELLALHGAKAKNSTLTAFMAYMVLIGAVLALVGYFLFPWIDMSSIPVEGGGGFGAEEASTLGDSLELLKSQFNEALDATGGVSSPELDTFRDAINGLKISFSGLDSTLLSLGLRNIFEVMGFQAYYDAILGSGFGGAEALDLDELSPQPEVKPLDYTLVLTPIISLIAVLIGFLLLRRATIAQWFICIVVGLV
ncbi:MAG: HEAT repeat domain-containing protein, partial [Chitinophagaceae bacterium]|nr:HEAT repeat domain-containing protein [Anaerolineae bacterium]